MNGTIKKLVTDKSFGFITGSDKREYFFHKQDLDGFWEDLVIDMEAGQTIPVRFESVPSTKGPRAGNVKRTDDANGVASAHSE
jgi:cold shock CspA family protein